MGVVDDSWLCGWRVRSEIPLPELLPWQGDDREPDISVRLQPIDDSLPDVVHDRRGLQISANGSCQFAVASVATYRVRAGCDVVIAPEADPVSAGIRLFLLGTVFGILCHQRGLVPLHASCVRVGDDTLAFTGRSGIGKSSVAAALWRHGCPLISDDLCVITIGDRGIPMVVPAFPRLRLWHDGVEALGFDPSALSAVRAGVPKYSVPVVESFDARARPLAGVYHLSNTTGVDVTRTRLDGADAFFHLRNVVYRRRVGGNRRAELFADLSQIARTLPHWTLPRPAGIDGIGRLADAIVAWHSAS